MLLEKAWAKLYGSYCAIARGLPGEALGDLTGAPVQFIPVDSPALFQRISEATCNDPQAKGKGWFVCGVIPLQDPTGQPMKYAQRAGHLTGHAYGVLDAHVVDDDCLLKLRNPFGGVEFTGEWSDDSNRWNNVSEEKKKSLGYERAEYDAFWMGLADFKAYFAGVQMNFVNTLTVGSIQTLCLSFRPYSQRLCGCNSLRHQRCASLFISVVERTLAHCGKNTRCAVCV